MPNNVAHEGPLKYRAMIGFFSVVLTFLFIWSIGFLVGDIGQIPGPDREEIHRKHVDAALESQLYDLSRKENDLESQIQDQRQVQSILQTSTQNSQQTLNQLSETFRNRVDGQTPPTAEELQALSEAREIFLENQKKFQEANDTITQLSEESRENARLKKELQDRIGLLEEGVDAEYGKLYRSHQIKTAALKLLFLLPLLFLATWMLKIKRGSRYQNLFLAFFVASFWHVAIVIHEYFPTEYFKYIAVIAAIAVVIGILHYLIRRITNPGRKWLVKQNQEAYQKHRCPVCSYPIERGALRQALWSGKGPKVVFATGQSGNGSEKETPYTCPSCGTGLFSECASCHQVRHTLLPYCEHCGDEKFPVAASAD